MRRVHRPERKTQTTGTATCRTRAIQLSKPLWNDARARALEALFRILKDCMEVRRHSSHMRIRQSSVVGTRRGAKFAELLAARAVREVQHLTSVLARARNIARGLFHDAVATRHTGQTS